MMPPLRHPGAAGKRRRVRVLQISDDLNLATTRLLLLEMEGYSAEHVSGRQWPGSSHLERFDLFLICQSVGAEQASGMIRRIRQEAPHGLVLRVRTDGFGHPSEEQRADLTLMPPARPVQLLSGLETLMKALAGTSPQET